MGSPPRPRARDSLLEEMTCRSLGCGPEGVGSPPLHCKCMTEGVSFLGKGPQGREVSQQCEITLFLCRGGCCLAVTLIP